MLLTRQYNHPIKSPGVLLTLALSTSTLGMMVVNPVFADLHAPTEPASTVLGYESALTGYRALDGSERTDWKQSNDTVGQIGGWRSYANEAYQAKQAEDNARENPEGVAEAAIRTPESTAATPVPAAANKGMDPTSALSENTARSKSLVQASERSGSRPLTIEYQSAMSTYRLYEDNPPGDWKAANVRVGEIGGWKTYAKEAYEAAKKKAQVEADSRGSQ